MLGDSIGKTYNRLTILKEFSVKTEKGKNRTMCECLCSCGNTHIARKYAVTQGKSKSCGCITKEIAIEKARKMGKSNTTHQMSRSRLYKIWDSMRYRCDNPNCKEYKNYGGRGIKYDDKWSDFNSFYLDMYEGYNDNLTLERIDVNKDYTKNNCTWITMYEQQSNKRNTLKINYKGQERRVVDICKEIGISPKTVHSRIRRGWKDEDLFVIPD